MGKKAKKEKKPLTKGKKIALVIILANVGVFLITLIVIGAMFGPAGYRFYFMEHDHDYTRVETALTVEQRLSDFDYMYKYACEENPDLKLFEDAYGISYDDLRNRYREYVANSKSDFEFLSYMSCYLALLPGIHNCLHMPSYYILQQQGFAMAEVYGTQEEVNYAESWHEEFLDDVQNYMELTLTEFYYVDGTYVGIVPDVTVKNYSTEYVGAQLISLNGKDPKDMCFELFETRTPCYDERNDCYFRTNIRFNESVGIKYTAELLMPDGTIVTTDLYDDPGFDIVCAESAAIYPELYGINAEEQRAKAQNEKHYRIETDADRKIVYIRLTQCYGIDIEEELQQAIDEIGADTVIIDNRANSGGSPSFVTNYLLPVLFTHDVDFDARYMGKVNDYTKNFIYDYINQVALQTGPVKVNDGYFYFHEDFSVKGRATKGLKIYMISSQLTCSAADIMTAVGKEYDNCVVIGTNTIGEGICGTPFNCILPESRWGFAYVPTISLVEPEDGYNGISPDVYIPLTVDEFLMYRDLKAQGVDANSYDVRLTWDQTLLRILEMEGKT